VLHGEGSTELVSDITMVCSGGTPLIAASGAASATASSPNAIPQMAVTVTLNSAVTSRILGGGISEAVLLVDEPGATGLGSYGSNLPISVCPTPAATAWQSAASPGCQEWVGNIGTNANVPVLSSGGQTDTTPGYNAFPGVVSGNQVTFNGVPMLAPGANVSRVFRITNVRLNASAVSQGAVAAQLSVTGVALSITNPTPTAAYVAPGLAASLRDSDDTGVLAPPVFAQSSGVGSAAAPNVVAYLRFRGNGIRTFMTRVSPSAAGSGGSGQSAAAEQSIPGAIYNSESGFTPYVGTTPQYFAGNTTYIPGLADSGTRVMAVFHNIPPGATVYVGTGAGSNTTSGLVVEMVSSPTTPESTPPVAPTITIGGVGFVTLAVSGGSATATWEVITSPNNPSGNPENFDIPVAVYVAPSAGPATVTVNMSFTPTYPQQFFPTFIDPSTPMNLFTIGTISATPAPASLILLLSGLAALGLYAAGRKGALRRQG